MNFKKLFFNLYVQFFQVVLDLKRVFEKNIAFEIGSCTAKPRYYKVVKILFRVAEKSLRIDNE